MGVLVAAGMLGGLSLYLATVTRQQHVTQRKAETGAELVELHHKIIAVLYDSDACLATLGKGNTLQVGPLNKLVNKGNKTMLAIGDEINRNLKVENMEIENIANAGPQSKQAEIKVTLKKLGVANAGVITEKRFKITVELDTAGKITRCHHTLDSKEHGIKTSMCEDVGGEMVSVPGSPTTECTLTKVYKKFCENLGGTYTDPAAGTPVGECDTNNVFQSYCTSQGGQYTAGTPIGTCNIADTYVDVAGDTMTGSLGTTVLRANSAVISGNIGANQGMFAANVSAANVNASGKVTAGGLAGTGTPPSGGNPVPSQPTNFANLNISCPSGQFLKGVNNGQPNCGAPSGGGGGTPGGTVGGSCPSGYTDAGSSIHSCGQFCYNSIGGSGSGQFVGGRWCCLCSPGGP